MTRSAMLTVLVILGFLCGPAPALGAEPRVDFVDCSSISPAVTGELLAIELKTLGIAVTPAMRWTVRCHEQKATVQLHGMPVLSEEVPAEIASGLPNALDVTASADVDLSSTDEAAWPRLIAISASELVEQVKRDTSMNAPTLANPTRESSVRVQLVNWAVKTKRKAQYLPWLGLSLGREGDPGTSLFGGSLGVDRRLGSMGLLGMDLRSQWGKTSLRDVNVSWQLTSLALAGGVALDLGAVNVDVMAGLRMGRIALRGEATTSDLSGRRLVGATAGPFATLRLRRSLDKRLFLGLAFEEGYGLLPVRGNYDGVSPLLTVKGLWANATFSVGWEL